MSRGVGYTAIAKTLDGPTKTDVVVRASVYPWRFGYAEQIETHTGVSADNAVRLRLSLELFDVEERPPLFDSVHERVYFARQLSA